LACAASDGGCGSGSVRARQPAAASAVHWGQQLDVAEGRAHAGPWHMNESDFDYVDDATVALADTGALGVAWADNSRKDVFFQMYGADGASKLKAPTNVSQSPQIFSWLPRLVISGDRVFALWQEIVFSGGSHGGDIFFSRSADAGASFGDPLNLSRSIGGDGKGRLTKQHWDNGSLDLIRDTAGTLLVAWTEYDGALWFSRSSDDGQSFTAPLRVGGSDQVPARGPSLARAQGQELYIVWASGENGAGALLLAMSRDAGQTFEAPRSVVQSTGQVDAPKLAVDDRGVLHLVYGERLNDDTPARVRYTRSSSAGRSIEAPRTISAPAGESGSSFPSLSLAAAGQVVVAWLHQASVSAPPRGVELTLSRDGGARFSKPELIPLAIDPALDVSGSRQGKLMRFLAANAAGALAVSSSSFREGQRSRIRVLRGQVP
jgi:hypothetical protein